MTQIEILPKIYDKTGFGDKEYETTKKVFLDMLGAYMGAPNSVFMNSNVETGQLPLYETFVRMFLDEALKIYRQGFKKGYSLVSGNETFVRGKLVVSQQVKKNPFHAERFFVEYDELDENQSENKLLKSTLEFLGKRSRNLQNRQDIKILLSEMSEIDCSRDIDGDFKKASIIERNNAHYKIILSWCRIFLRGESFTPFAGSEYATAVLFPMEDVYEKYVAIKLKQILQDEYDVYPQHNEYSLFNDPDMFTLVPDIVISKKSDRNTVVIVDTKWKLLNSKSDKKDKYGISVEDMYQMYVYSKGYQACGKNVKTVIMLYPQTSELRDHHINCIPFENTLDSNRVKIEAGFLGYRDDKFDFDGIVREIKIELRT